MLTGLPFSPPCPPPTRVLWAQLLTPTFRGSRFNTHAERRCSVTFHGKLNPTLLSVSSCPGRMDGPGCSAQPQLRARHLAGGQPWRHLPLGGGGDGRTGWRGFIWVMDGGEASLGVTYSGSPLTLAWTHTSRGHSGCSCLFQLPTLPRVLRRRAGGQGWWSSSPYAVPPCYFSLCLSSSATKPSRGECSPRAGARRDPNWAQGSSTHLYSVLFLNNKSR